MFLMIWDGVTYLTYVSYAAYVLMSRGKRRKIVIVSSLQKSVESPKKTHSQILLNKCTITSPTRDASPPLVVALCA